MTGTPLRRRAADRDAATSRNAMRRWAASRGRGANRRTDRRSVCLPGDAAAGKPEGPLLVKDKGGVSEGGVVPELPDRYQCPHADRDRIWQARLLRGLGDVHRQAHEDPHVEGTPNPAEATGEYAAP